MVATSPTINEILPPSRVRTRISRPTASVPNQWPVDRLGGVEVLSQSVKSDSHEISIGPNTTSRIMAAMMKAL